jgi:uncharacterized protein (TIGR02466 family)
LPDQLISLFPTTILKRRLEGMAENNRQLAALIEAMEAAEPNATELTSTKGGFQTELNLLAPDHPQANHPALLALKEHIGAAVRDYAGLLVGQECSRTPTRVRFTTWGWGVILRAGNWQGHHVHPGSNVSGVYYVAAPPAALQEGRDEGKISFFDPRGRANMAQIISQITRHAEAPTPGDMVVFPSWLEHSVAPFQGEGNRICIAFNAALDITV